MSEHPHHGGSYTRDKDGKLTVVAQTKPTPAVETPAGQAGAPGVTTESSRKPARE